MTDLPPGIPRDGRWLLLATSSERDAEDFARRNGLERVSVLSREDILGAGTRLPARLRTARFDVAAIYGPHVPSLRHLAVFELALLFARAPVRLVVDEEAGIAAPSAAALLRRVGALPGAALAGAASAGVRATGYSLRARGGQPPVHGARVNDPAVLAIWITEPGVAVGGAVTHAAGILGGLRGAGYRIGLVLAGPVPGQLADVVDDAEEVARLRPGARLSRTLHALALDGRIERAARSLAGRLHPTLVYQRHQPFLLAGLCVAADLGLPMVLEWNGSEAWTNANWRRSSTLSRRLSPLLVSMERHVAARASLVASVSEHAADMALAAGAAPERVVVVPNAVDIAPVDAAVAGRRPPDGPPRLGWIGSFGPWHGAEVLVRALAALPPRVTAVMIGDGRHRVRCESLARELAVDGRISFTGSLPHSQALAELASCDVLVSPHVPIPDQPFFGSPTKLFEYMALGRPIVASGLGQLGEVLRDGRTARLVEPGSPEALAAGIRDVLASPDRGAALGRAAREDAERHHTWKHRAAAILDRVDPAGSGARRSAPLLLAAR